VLQAICGVPVVALKQEVAWTTEDLKKHGNDPAKSLSVQSLIERFL